MFMDAEALYTSLKVMDLHSLTPEEEQLVRKKLGEDPIQLEKDVEIIQEWLKQQPHLPDELEKQYIVSYLRSCKYSLEKVKTKLDNLFAFRTALPEFTDDREPHRPYFQLLYKNGYVAIMPRLTSEGYRVYLTGIVSLKPEDLNFNNIARCYITAADLVMLRGGARAGEILIIDAKGFSMEHLLRVNFAEVRRFITFMQEVYPHQVKQIHVVNMSPVAEKVANIILPMLKEKISKRVHAHGSDYTKLLKMVPKEFLPLEFGGDEEPIAEHYKRFMDTVYSSREWILSLENAKADESLRPGEPRNFDNLFGMEGSFRQLTVD